MFSSSCLHSDFLGPALGRGQISSGEEGCLSSFEVDVDGPGESVEVFGGLLLLLEGAAATGGVDLSPHKFFVMKKSLLKRQIPESWKPALMFPVEPARCKDELTIRGMSYIVIVWPGWLVTQISHSRFAYVLSGP